MTIDEVHKGQRLWRFIQVRDQDVSPFMRNPVRCTVLFVGSAVVHVQDDRDGATFWVPPTQLMEDA